MKILNIRNLAIGDLKVVRFEKFSDSRGYFCETSRVDEIKKIKGFEGFSFQQSNESFSKKNVVRGLHFQWNPFMGKLVRTIKGHMVDIALDIRKSSSTFGKVVLYDMPENKEYGEWIWLPPGFAHGNFFLEDTIIEYFCTGSYNPESEACIYVFSGDLDLSLSESPLISSLDKLKNEEHIISEKDKNGFSLAQWQKKRQLGCF